MQYVGSKNRFAKHLLPHMLPHRKPGQWWVEPFVGGANMIDKVAGPRMGTDTNEYLIALLIAIRDGYVPPTVVTRDQYYDIKTHPSNYMPELVGFVGFACSFGGTWFGSYAQNSRGDNYASRGCRSLIKQAPNLRGIDFRHSSYLDLDIPDNSFIYCDPPYASTCSYRDRIDARVFWDWCRMQRKNGHTVYVSEYTAPNDFECVVEIPCVTVLNKNKPSKRTEKLFRERS